MAGSATPSGSPCPAGRYSRDGSAPCAECSVGLYSAAGARYCSTGLSEARTNALIALYNSTGGPQWLNQSGWLMGDPCVPDPLGWAGVECTQSSPYNILCVYCPCGTVFPVRPVERWWGGGPCGSVLVDCVFM